MIIIGILAVVLTESYTTISRVALKVEQEKNISEESLILTQVFQAISDEATIDYEKYEEKGVNLKSKLWFTDILYLTWWQRSWTSIYTTWGNNCLELDNNFLSNGDGTYPDVSEKVQNALSGCELVLQQWNEITTLTSKGKVITSKVMFRVVPYDGDENYFNSGEWIVVNNVHQPAFWMFIHLYAPFYQPIWTNKIDQPLQLFFNLKL